MSMTSTLRPGVYSSYDASAVISGSGGVKTVGLAAGSTAGTPGTVYLFTTCASAAEIFGSGENITALVGLLLRNGAAAVAAVPVAGGAYAAAFTALEGVEGLSVIVCDSTDLTVQEALRDSVIAASEARRERIAVVGCAAGESVEERISRAQALNSERVVLVSPGEGTGAAAAAVAGAIAGESDPAVPLGGAELKGLTDPGSNCTDAELDLLIAGGVTALESEGGVISVVRGVTTRTKTGGAADTTWREVNTILIADNVIPDVRNALKARFRRVKNTAQTRSAVRSQVTLLLEEKLKAEIITDYADVTAEPSGDDPTVCLAGFSFTVAQGLNQIWLTAHIAI